MLIGQQVRISRDNCFVSVTTASLRAGWGLMTYHQHFYLGKAKAGGQKEQLQESLHLVDLLANKVGDSKKILILLSTQDLESRILP